MIKTWHIIISGFTQTEAEYHGCQRLWLQLMKLANPHTVVIQPPWDYNWGALASRIYNTSTSDVRIFVYGYSWGCGNGVVNLAKELQKKELNINHAVLCDPVVYSSWPTWTAKFLTVFFRKSIDVPANIDRVDWFRQTNGLPYGCDLVATSQSTKISKAVVLDLTHNEMDEAPQWHNKCIEVAGPPT